jgi:DNA repair exonuclease SbcCD nuclease subunit
MKVIVTGDWHLEAGAHLGDADPEWGSSRLADAARILGSICAQEADLLIFLGDLARTAAPGPMAYRVAQEALAKFSGPIVLLHGNHDHGNTRESALHVVADGLEEAHVVDRPELIMRAGLQIGCLPWAVPGRLFQAAPHNPKAMNRLVGERLVDICKGMSTKLDGNHPNLLIAHWLFSGGTVGELSVAEVGEPLLNVGEIDLDWQVVLGGHNHVRQQLAENVWHVGPPLRGSFGEEQHEVGYAIVEYSGAKPTVAFHDTDDRQLVSIDLDVAAWLGGALTALPDVAGAIVRVKYTCTEEQAQAMAAGPARALVEELRQRGAAKVVGPNVRVIREREARSDLTLETDPMEALDTWMEQQGVEESLREGARERAMEVMV